MGNDTDPVVHAIGDAAYSFGEPFLDCSCGFSSVGAVDWGDAGIQMDDHLQAARERGETT